MNTPKHDSSRQRGPAGRTVGRAITLFAAHAVIVVVLAAVCIFVLSDNGPGLRHNLVYGRNNAGRMSFNGYAIKPIGAIRGTCKISSIRGVGGQIGLMARGTMTRTGPDEFDPAELLTAAERLADSLEESRYLQARAWCRQGPFVLFELKEGWVLVITATLATTAAVWAALFMSVRALMVGRVRRVRAKARRCIACGYPLDGLTERACPECGRLPTAQQL